MDIDVKNHIVAAVTLHSDRVGGGIPVFYVKDKEELVKTAGTIAKAVLGMVHALDDGTSIVVKH